MGAKGGRHVRGRSPPQLAAHGARKQRNNDEKSVKTAAGAGSKWLAQHPQAWPAESVGGRVNDMVDMIRLQCDLFGSVAGPQQLDQALWPLFCAS
jgi:hypothetical protein